MNKYLLAMKISQMRNTFCLRYLDCRNSNDAILYLIPSSARLSRFVSHKIATHTTFLNLDIKKDEFPLMIGEKFAKSSAVWLKPFE